MRDIGNAVGMNYACSASGSYVSNARYALVNNFGYSSSARFVDYNLNSLISELKSNRPVIIEAYHKRYITGWFIFSHVHYTMGHAWVCDGFQETIYKIIHNPEDHRYQYTTRRSTGMFLHMNWGWSEAGVDSKYNRNGWFKYDNFSISNGLNFQYSKKMIVGLQP